MVNPQPLTSEDLLQYLLSIIQMNVLDEIYSDIPGWIQHQLGNVAVADDFTFLVVGIAVRIETNVEYVITNMTKGVDRDPYHNPESNPWLDFLYLKLWLPLLAHNSNITGACYTKMAAILDDTHDSPDAARGASQELAQLYVDDKNHQDENYMDENHQVENHQNENYLDENHQVENHQDENYMDENHQDENPDTD
jgi:hypothetical protein